MRENHSSELRLVRVMFFAPKVRGANNDYKTGFTECLHYSEITSEISSSLTGKLSVFNKIITPMYPESSHSFNKSVLSRLSGKIGEALLIF